MPRLKGTRQQNQRLCSLNVSVLGERLQFQDIDNSKSVAWLIEEVERSYATRKVDLEVMNHLHMLSCVNAY